MFFRYFVAPEGWKIGSLKPGAEPWGDEKWKNYMPLWHEADLEVKIGKAPRYRIAFGSLDVENVHAVVARSTFRKQNWAGKKLRNT